MDVSPAVLDLNIFPQPRREGRLVLGEGTGTVEVMKSQHALLVKKLTVGRMHDSAERQRLAGSVLGCKRLIAYREHKPKRR